MESLKFDENNRAKVILEAERHFDVKLTRLGQRRKFLSDKNGRTFWILGGFENWHGIPEEMVLQEQKRPTNGILIIAKRDTSKIDIYSGLLGKLTQNAKNLHHTQNGNFHFNIYIKNDVMHIKEISDLSLSKICTKTDIETVKKMIQQLSEEQKKYLIEEFKNDRD